MNNSSLISKYIDYNSFSKYIGKSQEKERKKEKSKKSYKKFGYFKFYLYIRTVAYKDLLQVPRGVDSLMAQHC